ncbi:MAG: hypothetical protein LBQ14_02670, partial [Treponema sp.]|nr:hypothetical protein [Treponema sp.]
MSRFQKPGEFFHRPNIRAHDNVVLNSGFPKTSVFGKATLDLWEKTGLRPFFQEPSTKPTGFWEML